MSQEIEGKSSLIGFVEGREMKGRFLPLIF